MLSTSICSICIVKHNVIIYNETWAQLVDEMGDLATVDHRPGVRKFSIGFQYIIEIVYSLSQSFFVTQTMTLSSGKITKRKIKSEFVLFCKGLLDRLYPRVNTG